MSVNDLRHGLFVHESAVSGTTYFPQIRPKSPCMVNIVADNIITESAFHNLALVVNCEAEDASKLTRDVWLVLLIVFDEHSRYVGSAANVVGGE